MNDEVNAEAWYRKGRVVEKAFKAPEPANRPSRPMGWGGSMGHNYGREPIKKPRNNPWGRGG